MNEAASWRHHSSAKLQDACFTLSVLTHSTYENRSQGSTGPLALVKAEGNEGLTLPLKHSFPSEASPGLSRGTRRSWPVPRLCPHPQPYVLQGGWQLLQEERIPGSRNRCPMQGRKDVRLPVPSPLWKKGRYGKKADMGKAHFCQNEFMILGEVPEMQVISVLMLLLDTCKLASYKYSWRPRWPAPLLMGTCQCIKATSWWVPAPEHEGNQEGTLRSPSRPFTWRKKHTHENSSYLAPLSFHTVPFHISSTLYKERKCSSANDVSHSCV